MDTIEGVHDLVHLTRLIHSYDAALVTVITILVEFEKDIRTLTFSICKTI